MKLHAKMSVRCLGVLALLIVLVGALAGCGGPDPTAQIVVVTSTYTPTPQVLVVTATYTPPPPATDTPIPTEPPPATETPAPTDTAEPTDTPAPTDTPEPAPTDEPEPEPVVYVPYEHPSGVFGLEIPEDVQYDEGEDNLFFFYSDSLFMVLFTPLDTSLDSAELEDMIPVIMDSALLGEGLVTSYDNLETVQGDEELAAAAGRFDMTSDLFGDGEGGIVMIEDRQTLFILVLVTPDYEAVEEVWDATFGTLWTDPPEVASPPTAVPPTKAPPPTAKPQPTNTSPPPAANKGCYLFENHLDATVNITFTAQDWEWSGSVEIPAGASKEYCLDPGRYTYTMDAPPPWGSTNGELTVAAGDAFLWPIQGR